MTFYIYSGSTEENRLVKKGNITYAYDRDGNLLTETGGYRSAEYQYNGQNRMAYSEVTDHTNGAVSASEYAYDAFGRRTITQDAGRTAMRTLYDGFTFEVIRDSEIFQYGGFTVKGSPGIVAPSSPVQGSGDSSRFRLVTEGYSTWLPDGAPAPQGRANGETAVSAERKYVGISATLWANGEAVAINRYDTNTFTGGTVYLGKDALGSVRGATNDYGLLQERYEYDAFGKPYKGDLNSGMNLGYTGKPYDTTTGMYNYGYRDYQPEVARFTTIDPIRDGVNWFVYVNNDPVNYIDLWGLEDVYFIYTYTDSPSDQKMKKSERDSINDDVKYLEKNGLSVKVVESGTKQDIRDALYDPEAIVVVTSGHGYDPKDLVGIQTADDLPFTPSDIDTTKVSGNLQTVILENCYQGDNKNAWQTALGENTTVVGWNGTTTVSETKSFNGLGLFDRQDKNLRGYLEEAVEYKNQNSAKGNKGK